MKYICSLITVEDVNISKLFYETIMKQKVKIDFGENILFEGGFAIHLKSHFYKLIENKTITNASNSFELYFEHEDIDSFVIELKNNKIEFIHEIREHPWRQKSVRFYDPDKNIIEVAESMEYLSFRLSNEGKSIEEISKIINIPRDIVKKSINKIKSAGL